MNRRLRNGLGLKNVVDVDMATIRKLYLKYGSQGMWLRRLPMDSDYPHEDSYVISSRCMCMIMIWPFLGLNNLDTQFPGDM
jgi:hypothetical protein